jgi:hypothetical protein
MKIDLLGNYYKPGSRLGPGKITVKTDAVYIHGAWILMTYTFWNIYRVLRVDEVVAEVGHGSLAFLTLVLLAWYADNFKGSC